MPDALQRFIAWLRTPKGRTMIKFSCVSLISTAVAQGTLWIVYYDLRLWTAVVCNIFANACAILPSYTLNRRWAWKKTGRSDLLREVIPFWGMSAAGMGLSIGTVSYAAHVAHAHHLGHLSTSILVNAANFFAFGVLWILKFLVFNRLFKAVTGEEMEPILLEV
ncbi:MAG: GtrA family protein [Acidimicrobiales bacterium]|jgi:putative flippase GtrA